MKIDYEATKIFVRPGSPDLRKGTSGLLAIIENEMNLNVLDNSIFIFCNKNHKLIKVIFSPDETKHLFQRNNPLCQLFQSQKNLNYHSE